jgi:hypothetical protein
MRMLRLGQASGGCGRSPQSDCRWSGLGSRGLLDHQLIEQGVDAGEGGGVSSHGDHLGWEKPDV